MLLRKYLDKKGIKINKFAEQAKVNRKTIYNALDGKDILLSVAVKISDTTEGVVTIRELHQDKGQKSKVLLTSKETKSAKTFENEKRKSKNKTRKTDADKCIIESSFTEERFKKRTHKTPI